MTLADDTARPLAVAGVFCALAAAVVLGAIAAPAAADAAQTTGLTVDSAVEYTDADGDTTVEVVFETANASRVDGVAVVSPTETSVANGTLSTDGRRLTVGLTDDATPVENLTLRFFSESDRLATATDVETTSATLVQNGTADAGNRTEITVGEPIAFVASDTEATVRFGQIRLPTGPNSRVVSYDSARLDTGQNYTADFRDGDQHFRVVDVDVDASLTERHVAPSEDVAVVATVDRHRPAVVALVDESGETVARQSIARGDGRTVTVDFGEQSVGTYRAAVTDTLSGVTARTDRIVVEASTPVPENYVDVDDVDGVEVSSAVQYTDADGDETVEVVFETANASSVHRVTVDRSDDGGDENEVRVGDALSADGRRLAFDVSRETAWGDEYSITVYGDGLDPVATAAVTKTDVSVIQNESGDDATAPTTVRYGERVAFVATDVDSRVEFGPHNGTTGSHSRLYTFNSSTLDRATDYTVNVEAAPGDIGTVPFRVTEHGPSNPSVDLRVRSAVAYEAADGTPTAEVVFDRPVASHVDRIAVEAPDGQSVADATTTADGRRLTVELSDDVPASQNLALRFFDGEDLAGRALVDATARTIAANGSADTPGERTVIPASGLIAFVAGHPNATVAVGSAREATGDGSVVATYDAASLDRGANYTVTVTSPDGDRATQYVRVAGDSDRAPDRPASAAVASAVEYERRGAAGVEVVFETANASRVDGVTVASPADVTASNETIEAEGRRLTVELTSDVAPVQNLTLQFYDGGGRFATARDVEVTSATVAEDGVADDPRDPRSIRAGEPIAFVANDTDSTVEFGPVTDATGNESAVFTVSSGVLETGENYTAVFSTDAAGTGGAQYFRVLDLGLDVTTPDSITWAQHLGADVTANRPGGGLATLRDESGAVVASEPIEFQGGKDVSVSFGRREPGTYSVTVVDNQTGASVRSGTVVVHPSLPAVDGGRGQPTDPDGDGLYEDVNGNGEGDFGDVTTMFSEFARPEVSRNAVAYDFNENGELDFGDVVALFERV